MVEKKKIASEKKKIVKKEEPAGCSGQCWCCSGHGDFEEEEDYK